MTATININNATTHTQKPKQSNMIQTIVITIGPAYQSRIGDKFSKKKAVLNAIRDPMQKFAGE